MDNKYYIPKIEELHHDFECEVFFENKWNLCVIQNNDGDFCVLKVFENKMVKFVITENTIDNRKIRVKYLDQEDIKSIGWKYLSKSNVNNFVFDKLPYRMNVNFATDKNLPKLSIYIYDGEIVNRIIIKNKSELKKLMQQLNIKLDGK